MRIEVTDSDIAQGLRHECHQCPIAYALRRASGVYDVMAGAKHIRIGDRGYATPAAAESFIRHFDQGHTVLPFEFTLGEPYPVITGR